MELSWEYQLKCLTIRYFFKRLADQEFSSWLWYHLSSCDFWHAQSISIYGPQSPVNSENNRFQLSSVYFSTLGDLSLQMIYWVNHQSVVLNQNLQKVYPVNLVRMDLYHERKKVHHCCRIQSFLWKFTEDLSLMYSREEVTDLILYRFPSFLMSYKSYKSIKVLNLKISWNLVKRQNAF